MEGREETLSGLGCRWATLERGASAAMTLQPWERREREFGLAMIMYEARQGQSEALRGRAEKASKC